MDKQKSVKDSVILIFLSIITLAGVVLFVVKLWFPGLLKQDNSISENISYEEENYDDSDIPKISSKELKDLINSGEEIVILDVQNTEDYVQATIPTAISIPLTEIDQRYEELPKNKKIIAVDAGGNCQECSRAVEILMDYGYTDIKKLDGGVNAWANAGYPVSNGSDVTFQNMNSDGLLDFIDANEDVVIVDVRDEEEYNSGHIKGAIHLSFEGLSEDIQTIAKDKKIIVYDEKGNRSKVAVKQFIMNGYIDVVNLLKGYEDWKSNNYPIESI